jgi:glycogen debranching enzyme
MRVVHVVGNNSLSKDVAEDCSFMLTNKAGSFVSFSSFPKSKFDGFFAYENGEMFKVLDWIKVEQQHRALELRNHFVSVERKRGDFVEGFFLPRKKNCLVYELSKEKDVELVFDVRKAYDLTELGRDYSVSVDGNEAIIEFRKKKDNFTEFKVFVVVVADKPLEKVNKWVEHFYSLDESRGDSPSHWNVFYGLKFKGSRCVIAASTDKKRAIDEAVECFVAPKELLVGAEKEFVDSCPKVVSSDLDFAKVCALNSLDGLVVGNEGVFAGLPWFFQFWVRDEAIALKALIDRKHYDFVRDVILTSSRSVGFDGKCIAIRRGKVGFDVRNSADGLGWVYKRLHDLITSLEFDRNLGKHLSKKDLHVLKDKVEHYLFLLIKFSTKDDLAVNDVLETWMDTFADGDNRAGVRIEIQALRLSMYQLMYELTSDIQYKNLEITMKKGVVKNFWNNTFLADGLNDFTIRPNIFLACYIYPDLLHKEEWRDCFRNSLPFIWLDWGGLSTIDKKNRLFCAKHSGMDARSYHRGDSWFWVNNLAAIAMRRVDAEYFASYIEKIMKASAEEILWKGCVGCASELSSAEQLRSEGCWNQAWSNSTFLELLKELGK